MDCGVPFCQAGMMIGGMASGCPLNNLIPEWNDLVYQRQVGAWRSQRLKATNRFPGVHQPGLPRPVRGGLHLRRWRRGSSVAVRENEHAIVEYGLRQGLDERRSARRRAPARAVAVVGSGPSGLSVAEQLNMPRPQP